MDIFSDSFIINDNIYYHTPQPSFLLLYSFVPLLLIIYFIPYITLLCISLITLLFTMGLSKKF